MGGRLAAWAKAATRDAFALALALRDPRVPWYAKLLAAAVVAYAVSPVDLIPDFIPVLGLLDDIVLVPLGMWFAIRMIPPAVMDDLREKATAAPDLRTGGLVAAAIVVSLWAATGIGAVLVILSFVREG